MSNANTAPKNTPVAQDTVSQPKPTSRELPQQRQGIPTKEGSVDKVIQPVHDLHKPLVKKNISSEALELQEVEQIAQELHKDLDTQKHQPSVMPSSAPVATAPKPITPKFNAHNEETDTIVIDQDGNLVYKDPEA
jgi:hypothetical protein